MSKLRMGELLGEITGIGPMDVEEILQDQAITHRRFGEIALSWGLCEPQDIWSAWFNQLNDRLPRINLDDFGVDAQAASLLPREIAEQFMLVGVRVFGNQLVVAMSPDNELSPPANLDQLLGKNVRYVLAKSDEIRAAIDRCYSSPVVAE